MSMSDQTYKQLVESNFGQPPAWCAGAVATDQGWVNPKTKEIYSCIPKLKTRIEEFEAEKARRAAAPVVEAAEEVAAPVAEVVTKEEAKPAAKKAPAKRKTTKKG